MNLVRFGVDGLDRLIGGGVLQGKAYLLEYDVGTKPRSFIFPFIAMGVAEDEACRLDILRYTYDEVVEDMMNAGFDADEAVRSGKLAIVDYANGRIHIGSESVSINGASEGSAIDLVSAFRLSEECWSRIASRASTGARMMLQGGAVLFRQLGSRDAIRFIETQIRLVKSHNAVFVTDVNPRSLHPVELAALEELFDGIVELTTQWENRRLQKYVTVKDSPLPRFRRERVPYEIVVRENIAVGVSIGVALGEDFEAFKSTLALVAPGVIESQREGRMVLHYAHGIKTLHKTAFEQAGYERGYEIIYRWGESATVDVLKSMIGEMKTAVAALADGRDKAVDMFAKFISTRGWGDFKLSKTTGDNPKIHAVVHNIPVGEAMRGYGKPVDAYMAGCVAGIASLILGEGVLCRETKCVAMGDERCEFEASRLSDTPTLTHTPANSRNKTA